MKNTIVQCNIWHTGSAISEQARRVTNWRRERDGRWQSWRVISNRRWRARASISPTSDVDGAGSGSLLDSILSTLLKKWSSDIWKLAHFLSHHTRASSITTAFKFACGHRGLEIKILYYCTLYSTVQKSTQNFNHLQRMHKYDKVCQTHELTYVMGHANACSHLWKFTTWRFICREYTVLFLYSKNVCRSILVF